MNIKELLQEYQLNVMLVLSTVCGLLAFFVAITKTMPKNRRRILIGLELSSMFLLISDRMAYHFRGNTTDIGFWMVRISNFLVFLLSLAVIMVFTLYLIDLYAADGGVEKTPLRLNISCAICCIAAVLLIISQFTGIYYTFDEYNRYQRSDGFMVCYLFPLIILILNLSVIIDYRKCIRKPLFISILLFSSVPLIAAILQLFVYGLSLINISIVGMAVVFYVFSIFDMNETVKRANQLELDIVRSEQRNMRTLFEQTAAALANAIDAKDKYTHGHSHRVAEYSVEIAKNAGKSEKECEEIYFAALLHDVGKIGVKDSIINKEGRLTDAEFAAIKEHPVIGEQILSSIRQSPYLSIGAHYHHERFDGRGYPERLKGEDIPDIARIIAVADAYDAMTSKRSYRDPLPQQIVREELVKGIGSQFDPNYAKIMIHLIDVDSEYKMKERGEVNSFESRKEIVCGMFRSDVSEGILLSGQITKIHLSTVMDGRKHAVYIPSLILFDSLDGCVHDDERKCRDLMYFEYAALRFDGVTDILGARNIRVETTDLANAENEGKAMMNEKIDFDITAARYDDHAIVTISNKFRSHKFIIALADSARFAYLAITGEHCIISDVDVTKAEETIGEGDIPRIAEKISFINGPVGDIPNVQINGWRSDSSQGMEITNGMRVQFHTMSLPTARLIWHCPFVVLYTSDDGQVGGRNYRELTVVRLDGEGWEEDDHAENHMFVSKLDSFSDWNEWKEMNKAGQECEIQFRLKKGSVTITSEFCGLSIRSVTLISDEISTIYAALTGDQCALRIFV